MLFGKPAPGENLVVRGARVLDPAGKVDGVLDVIGPELVGYEASEQRLIDQRLIDLVRDAGRKALERGWLSDSLP